MKHLTPIEAHERLRAEADALLIDCRSEVEFMYVGHPVGAVHVAWQEAPEWQVNPDFAAQVLREAGSASRPILVICRSGNRSVEAAAVLEAAGFSDVSNVLDGFEGPLDENDHRGTRRGWRHDGLPWQQM
jgi:rhodanese-related sulfurtransferase